MCLQTCMCTFICITHTHTHLYVLIFVFRTKRKTPGKPLPCRAKAGETSLNIPFSSFVFATTLLFYILGKMLSHFPNLLHPSCNPCGQSTFADPAGPFKTQPRESLLKGPHLPGARASAPNDVLCSSIFTDLFREMERWEATKGNFCSSFYTVPPES